MHVCVCVCVCVRACVSAGVSVSKWVCTCVCMCVHARARVRVYRWFGGRVRGIDVGFVSLSCVKIHSLTVYQTSACFQRVAVWFPCIARMYFHGCSVVWSLCQEVWDRLPQWSRDAHEHSGWFVKCQLLCKLLMAGDVCSATWVAAQCPTIADSHNPINT